MPRNQPGLLMAAHTFSVSADNSRNILCEGKIKIKKQQEKVSVSL